MLVARTLLVATFLAQHVVRCRNQENRLAQPSTEIMHSSSHPSSPRPKIILDTDPAGLILTGLDVDDDLAILNALSLHRAGSIQLMGLTITGGNAPIRYTYPNALDLVRYQAGISKEDIGLYRGGPPLTANARHRLEQEQQSPDEAGDGNIPGISSEATRFLINTIMHSDEKTITVLCIGPLTNIAAAFLLEPRIADRIQRIVSMGGTLTQGLPYDLNIRTDPVAASIVWNEMNCKKIMIPIETCLQAAFGTSQLKVVEQRCYAEHSTRGKPVMCTFLTRLQLQRRIMPWVVNRHYIGKENRQISENARDGFIMWDLVALWATVNPDLFDNWTYFKANLLPFERTGMFRFYSGPKIDWWGHQRYETEAPPSDHRNLLLIPLALKKENDLHQLVLDHLWTPNVSRNSNHEQHLSIRDRLGSLPDLVALLAVMVLGTLVVHRGLRKPRRSTR